MPAGIESRFHELAITLPAPPSPGGNYVSGPSATLFFSQESFHQTLPASLPEGWPGSVEEGYPAAHACALTQLAVLRRHLGSLDAIKSIVSINGYVNAVAGFADSPEVINGASDLFIKIFDDAGRHVRAAIGVSTLPRKALVELQMTVEI